MKNCIIKRQTTINKKLLASLQLGTLICLPAYAQEVTITDDVTTSISTSTASSGSAADVIIAADGSITVESGAAITIDSDNSVSLQGGITNESFNNGAGIHVSTNAGDPIVSSIDITGSLKVSTLNDSGVTGDNNYGILVDGDGIFQGNIINESPNTIDISGNNSAGISIQADMVGNIELDNIKIKGANSNGLEIFENLTGNILTKSTVEAKQSGNHAVYIGGNVTGSYRNLGSLTTGTSSGFNSLRERIDAVASTSSIRISSDVTGGVANDIAYYNSSSVEVNVAEGASTTDGISSSRSGTITAIGGGYALWVSPEKLNDENWSNITIGGTNSFYGDYSILNQGKIEAHGENSGTATTAIMISGATNNTDTYTTTIENGFYNGLWGNIDVTATNATAKAIHIGNYASMPEFVNNGDINVTVNFDEDVSTGGDAYGLLLEENASLGSFENTGVIQITAIGDSNKAYAIVDRSGTVTNFLNTGLISATNSSSSATNVAVDFSANNSAIDFSSSGRITGDVHLSSGTNTVSLEGLTLSEIEAMRETLIASLGSDDELSALSARGVFGAIYVGNNTNTLTMADNSILSGGIYSESGRINVALSDQSILTVPADKALNVTDLAINDQSRLNINISEQDTFSGGIDASGSVTFSQDSELNVNIKSLISNEATYQIISAGDLTIDETANITNSSENIFIYDIETALTATTLDVTLRRKTAVELELTENLTQIYDASISALQDTDDIAAEISSIKTKEEFDDIYTQMMPSSLSQASRQILVNSNNLFIGAVAGQMDNLRYLKKTEDNPLSNGQGLWVQQYGSKYNHDVTLNEKGSNGFTFGIAGGYEFAVTKRGAIGFSLSRNFADIKIDGKGKSRIIMENTQAGLYGTVWFNKLFLQAQANIGLLHFEGDRDVVFNSFTRTSSAKWGGLQYSSNFKSGFDLEMGPLTLTPTAGINYTKIKQDGFTESGGGQAVDLDIAEFRTSSLAGNLKLELSYQTPISSGEEVVGDLKVNLHGGWSKELRDDPLSVTANFAGYNDTFTLQSDPLTAKNYSAGLGIYFITDITAFSINLDTDWKDNYMGHSATMNFRVRF